MQILKDEVRHNIVQAALSEFKREGYLTASMRQIAKSAGITSGNVYRYFKNKEELFDAIVGPVHEQYAAYMQEISQEIEHSRTRDAPEILSYFRKVEGTIVELFKSYSSELMILLNRSDGSKYEKVKPELVDLAFSILDKVIVIKKSGQARQLQEGITLARMLAATIVEGICLILRDNEEGDTLKRLIDQYMHVYSEGIAALLGQM
ncbi:TetR/AcrR family transcriptional regulator [Paenibacillus eucommiae]|uniref:AcrR family transcriptional regulator n=1 Tax=Paenibacillus eucommiae TaxID=1355755 RepID=A0ABS4IUG5_9BACL|nr:TetR/AcrR family transcriptional regulator [Paenibacillus eucommiae]MBP1991219.1 AcrR family transcriptional regulator [Paenibacillus eucommiae]